MPLKLIHGPLNSGRAGQIRRRLLEDLARSPLLVVPTGDDVFAIEQELCGENGASLGAAVVDFNGLIRQVAVVAGAASSHRVTATQSVMLTREAARRSGLRILAGSARRAGFAIAAERLIGELRGTLLDSDSLAASAAEDEGNFEYLEEIVAIHREYGALLDQQDLEDAHRFTATAITGLRSRPDAWGKRPVYLYGFDDLAPAQLELVSALASACTVTVSLTYEDRVALGARAVLLAELRQLEPIEEEATRPQPSNTSSPLLFHLERNFAEPDSPRMAPDETLAMLSAAGERSEVELIGSEVSRLIANGTDPGEIAIVLRSPAGRGPLFRMILESYGIPVALEARVPIRSTATGGAVLAILRAAFTSRSAADLISFLRAPRRMSPSDADWLERRVLRDGLQTSDQVAEAFEELAGRKQTDFARLRDAEASSSSLLAAVAILARDVAEWPLSHRGAQGRVPGPTDSEELRAGALIATAAEELAELGDLAELDPEVLIETFDSLELPLWRGPALGRVRIASPYQFRAARFEHVFVASLQDGEFPRRGSQNPFLSDDQRATLRLPQRAEEEAEERYLFYSCLSLPTEKLWLSSRSVDEDGGDEEPSPLLDEIRRLLDPPPEDGPGVDPVLERITHRRTLGELTFLPENAPGETELTRSLAGYLPLGSDAPDLTAERLVDALSIRSEPAGRIAERLVRARSAAERADRPGPLTVSAVRDFYADQTTFGGTTLENAAVCSYKWFISHELDPQGLVPTPEPLAAGSLVHSILQRVYEERPGGDPIPRGESLAEWRRRASELLGELAVEGGLGSSSPSDRAARAKILQLINGFLAREASRESPALVPSLFEACFGIGEDAAKPPLNFEGWELHGKIDRVDLHGNAALIQDYKFSKSATPVANFGDLGKLQLPLYAIAARELWGFDVIGGIYQPLAATVHRDKRPRGLLRETARDDDFADLDLVDNDLLPDVEFEASLAEARERAGKVVARIQRGDIDRNPIGGKCPPHCVFAPICRRERGLVEASSEGDE